MAAEVIWTHKAIKDRFEILKYWSEKNKSTSFSIKLNSKILETIKLISDFPDIGIKTDIENVSVKSFDNYLLFYETSKEKLIILRIIDSRRDINNIHIK